MFKILKRKLHFAASACAHRQLSRRLPQDKYGIRLGWNNFASTLTQNALVMLMGFFSESSGVLLRIILPRLNTHTKCSGDAHGVLLRIFCILMEREIKNE
jgi:hypothetical protein